MIYYTFLTLSLTVAGADLQSVPKKFRRKARITTEQKKGTDCKSAPATSKRHFLLIG